MHSDPPRVLVLTPDKELHRMICSMLDGLGTEVEHCPEWDETLSAGRYMLLAADTTLLDRLHPARRDRDVHLSEKLIILGHPHRDWPVPAFLPGRDNIKLRLFLLNRVTASRERSLHSYDRRIYRILELLIQLLSGTPVSVAHAAAEYNVSTRTVRRDLQLLDALGFVNSFDPARNGHRLLEPDRAAAELQSKLLEHIVQQSTTATWLINSSHRILSANTAAGLIAPATAQPDLCYTVIAERRTPCPGCPLISAGLPATCCQKPGFTVLPVVSGPLESRFIIAFQLPVDRSGAGNRSLQRIISLLAHDLRSPLHSLAHLLELLRPDEQTTPVRIPELLVSMEQQLEHALQRIDSILHWYRWSEREGVSAEPVHLKQLLQRQLDNHRVKKLFQINLTCESVLLQIQRPPLERIIDNLLDNISRHADPEEPVSINGLERGMWIELGFENRMAHKSAGLKSNGRFGLLLTAELVKQLHGELQIRSDCSKGSYKATVLLPATPPPQTDPTAVSL